MQLENIRPLNPECWKAFCLIEKRAKIETFLGKKWSNKCLCVFTTWLAGTSPVVKCCKFSMFLFWFHLDFCFWTGIDKTLHSIDHTNSKDSGNDFQAATTRAAIGYGVEWNVFSSASKTDGYSHHGERKFMRVLYFSARGKLKFEQSINFLLRFSDAAGSRGSKAWVIHTVTTLRFSLQLYI